MKILFAALAALVLPVASARLVGWKKEVSRPELIAVRKEVQTRIQLNFAERPNEAQVAALRATIVAEMGVSESDLVSFTVQERVKGEHGTAAMAPRAKEAGRPKQKVAKESASGDDAMGGFAVAGDRGGGAADGGWRQPVQGGKSSRSGSRAQAKEEQAAASEEAAAADAAVSAALGDPAVAAQLDAGGLPPGVDPAQAVAWAAQNPGAMAAASEALDDPAVRLALTSGDPVAIAQAVAAHPEAAQCLALALLAAVQENPLLVAQLAQQANLQLPAATLPKWGGGWQKEGKKRGGDDDDEFYYYGDDKKKSKEAVKKEGKKRGGDDDDEFYYYGDDQKKSKEAVKKEARPNKPPGSEEEEAVGGTESYYLDELFGVIDANGDGLLSKDEALAAAQQLGFTEADLGAQYAQLDAEQAGVAEADLQALLGLWVEVEVYSVARVGSEAQADAAQAALRAQFADPKACRRLARGLGLDPIAGAGVADLSCTCAAAACPVGTHAAHPPPPHSDRRRLKAGAGFDTNNLNCASLLTGTH